MVKKLLISVCFGAVALSTFAQADDRSGHSAEKHAYTITPLLGEQYANGDSLTAVVFKAQTGLSAIVGCCGSEQHCSVEHFQMIRRGYFNGSVRLFNHGSQFLEEARRHIDMASPGDVYLFYDIIVRCPNSSENRNAGALQITIK